MAQSKCDLFRVAVHSRNHRYVLFEHTQGIRMEAAELRNGLHLATTGTDKGTSRRSLLNWGSPELMRALLRQGALSAAAVWRPSSAAGRPVEKFHPAR